MVERKGKAKCVAEIGVFFRDAQLPLGKAVWELLLVPARKAVGRTSRNFIFIFFGFNFSRSILRLDDPVNIKSSAAARRVCARALDLFNIFY